RPRRAGADDEGIRQLQTIYGRFQRSHDNLQSKILWFIVSHRAAVADHQDGVEDKADGEGDEPGVGINVIKKPVVFTGPKLVDEAGGTGRDGDDQGGDGAPVDAVEVAVSAGGVVQLRQAKPRAADEPVI